MIWWNYRGYERFFFLSLFNKFTIKNNKIWLKTLQHPWLSALNWTTQERKKLCKRHSRVINKKEGDSRLKDDGAIAKKRQQDEKKEKKLFQVLLTFIVVIIISNYFRILKCNQLSFHYTTRKGSLSSQFRHVIKEKPQAKQEHVRSYKNKASSLCNRRTR